ncbi:PAS domain S-box protein [Methylobacter sp.]|uniref:hybrid sensor histidine kinase/response regulator n=1 Tax=Methylobacter sp. TaxID=2051955 RepID=UPI00121C6541|nr:PAS domain S-box protein [Methylobacter sp.]TAK60265.1 MAG: PAS domain S-box protein [Methylobacter sp.]
MKFLIIDDDAVERSLTIKTLRVKFADSDIVEVGSREAFDEKIAEAGFDLAIVEYQLGWTDGLTLFKAIKLRFVCLPVIMLTNSGNEDIAVTAIKSGMANYIVKRNRHTLLDEIDRSLIEAKKRRTCPDIDNKFQLYERRDPFISRFTRDFAYFIRIPSDGKLIFEWVTEPLKQLINNAAFHGESKEQNRDWVLPIHPDDISIVQHRYKKLLTGSEDTSEYRVIINKSEIRYFSDHTLPVRDPIDGKVMQLYGVMQDITARRKVEEKLYLMQHAIDSSSNGIIITGLADTDYAIIYANAAFLRITGYSMQELLGQNCRILQNNDRDQSDISRLRTALQNNHDTHAVLRNYRKNGSLFWSEIYISPIHDQQGRITHYIGVQNDVTHRVEMEYALSKSETRMRSVFNNVSDSIIIIDENGIIEKLNPSAEKLFGYSAQELIGHNINKLMPESDRNRHDSYLAHYLSSGKAKILDTRREVNGLRKDGSIFPMELGVSEFYVDQRHFFIGTAHDITERKKAEEALRDFSCHLEKVREDERTRIAREIHDELGSLLTALKMDLSWLNKQLLADLSLCHEKIAVMNRYLDDGIGSVRKIIADLRPTILDHLGLLAAIDWKIDEFREQNDIQCILTAPENNIVMDEGRDIAVFRIMQEALTNIALHSRATHVTLDVETSENSLMMKMTDNGCGMTKAQMQKSGKYGILGMHERARHFGGEVEIVSEPGKGTTLVLNMHLKSPSAPVSKGEIFHD